MLFAVRWEPRHARPPRRPLLGRFWRPSTPARRTGRGRSAARASIAGTQLDPSNPRDRLLKGADLLAASNYPFLDVVWTMVIFFCWIIWFMLLFRVIADIFRRHDIHGGGKTLWLIFVIILPF